MRKDPIVEAKRFLPLPSLMALLGDGDFAKKSAPCPFHQDAHNSFSIYQRSDGNWAWKCHAGCGGGDEPDYLAKHKDLSIANACREYIRLSGARPPSKTQDSNPSLSVQLPFDWQSCVAALTAENRAQLAEWRAYAPEFVEWMHSNKLIGLFDDDRIALPVHDAGRNIIGCHYRINDDGTWRYHPTGTRTAPLIIGDNATATIIFAFESQWDFCAVADKLEWHITIPSNTASIITRGAGNARLLTGLCTPDAIVYTFGQNDQPNPTTGIRAGEKWLAAIAANSGCTTFQVVTPSPHKDLNDWTRAGATRAEIEAAIAAAEPVTVPTVPDLRAPPPQNVLIPAIALPEGDDEAPATFPIECLPPAIALMVRAVATTQRVPDSLPGVMALALVAASIGKGLVLDWRPDGSPTPANLFAVVSAMSGSGKSECSKKLAKPFLDFERALQEHWRKEVMPKLQADLRFHENQLKKLDRKLVKDSTRAEDAERFRAEMVFHQAKMDELKLKLHEPQLSIQDATVEKVATVMHHNDETTFSTSSDARKLCDNLLGRYSANKKFADDGIYLNAYSGDDVKVDRQGREGVRLANPCMTLSWALQPDALEMLLDEDSLQQGGWLARCLIAHTHAEPQHIGGDVRPISDDVRTAWENLIRSLLITYRQPPTLPATETATMAEGIL